MTRIILSKRKFDGVVFDLDGVITQSARVHFRAWKKMFDDFLSTWCEQNHKKFLPFTEKDYAEFVDGKPRYHGVKSFLEARHIELPFGTPEDSAGEVTICGLGNRKNHIFLDSLKKERVEVYEGSVSLVHKLQEGGFKVAVVSSSKNCSAILESAGLKGLFKTQVDGVVSQHLNLKGKPAPDIFLQAAKELEVEPKRGVVFEDSLAGVEAGVKGGFGCVVGVDRAHQSAALQQRGATYVVTDLADIVVEW